MMVRYHLAFVAMFFRGVFCVLCISKGIDGGIMENTEDYAIVCKKGFLVIPVSVVIKLYQYLFQSEFKVTEKQFNGMYMYLFYSFPKLISKRR